MFKVPALCLCVVLGLASALALPAADTAKPVRKPNIVYILADDLGYGDVQSLNPQRGQIATPQLDRFAAQSMTFTDAHSGSSVCTPTRYGLLTGRYAWRTRLQKGVLDGGSEEPLISSDRVTVAKFLKEQGYATACIGKWHLGYEFSVPAGVELSRAGAPPLGTPISGGPIARGFDYFLGCSNARTITSLVENDRVVEILPPVEMLPRITQRAIDYLGEQAEAAKSGRPFFLYVPLTSPHLPLVPSAEWKGKSSLGAYGDFVMQTDDSIGRILAALEQQGLAENTLVIVTSDNGCEVKTDVKKMEAQGHFASAQYRGYKADIWEGGHRVPFFVRWPGVVKPASRNEATIGLGDFFSTTAELLGVALPDSVAPDSVSFLRALSGQPIPALRAAIVHHSTLGMFAVREGRWKLILGGGSGGYGKPSNEEAQTQGLPDAQLYDLEADPGEITNLVTTRRTETLRLAALLRTYVAEGRSTPGSAQVNDVEVKLPLLASLATDAVKHP